MVDFKSMSYVEFISFIKETNRCPGGKDTINWILRNSFATKHSRVLEIGSNTGFSSFEVARTLKCSVLGIDPVPEAVKVSQETLREDSEEIQGLVKFQVGSAYNIPCDDSTIDLIIAGGSTSFMDDKEQAVYEMERVLKPWGMLSATNLYYHTEPPKSLVSAISSIIGVTIQPMSADEWVNVYTNTGRLELYKLEYKKLSSRSDEEIAVYIDYFMNKTHILSLSDDERRALKTKWNEILAVFNENHKYLGFIKVLLRKRTDIEEPELFKLNSSI